MKRRLLILGIPFLLAAAPAEKPEEPKVSVQVVPDRTRATVGDRILVKITVTHPPEFTILPPEPDRGEAGTMILEPAGAAKPEVVTEKKEGASAGPAQEIFFFRAQAFETGKTAIPPFQVPWQVKGGGAGTARSEPVPIEIVSVLKGPQDPPADLKAPAELPPPPFPWKWAGAGLFALAAVAAAFWLWKRRRKRPLAPAPAPPRRIVPPHELAYQELERLLASGLLREGRIKEFHVELAEIVKCYLAGRFQIETLERTSEEVLDEMRRVRVGSGAVGVAGDFLAETDLVKFARYLPLEEEIRRTVDRAYRLVDQTKLVAAPASPGTGEAPPALSPEAAP
jgi:hypothetical protein